MWDRPFLRRLFGFDHLIEVYKREHERVVRLLRAAAARRRPPRRPRRPEVRPRARRARRSSASRPSRACAAASTSRSSAPPTRLARSLGLEAVERSRSDALEQLRVAHRQFVELDRSPDSPHVDAPQPSLGAVPRTGAWTYATMSVGRVSATSRRSDGRSRSLRHPQVPVDASVVRCARRASLPKAVLFLFFAILEQLLIVLSARPGYPPSARRNDLDVFAVDTAAPGFTPSIVCRADAHGRKSRAFGHAR